jgi:hypothetical protein
MTDQHDRNIQEFHEWLLGRSIVRFESHMVSSHVQRVHCVASDGDQFERLIAPETCREFSKIAGRAFR